MLPYIWQGNKINLMDTPGYPDFIGEVKSAIRVSEGSVIVVCASSGVEVGTEQVWAYCNASNLPRCETCPAGAVCKDSVRSCGLRWSNQSCDSSAGGAVTGTWARQPLSSGDDHYKLTSCPPGTERQTEEELGTPDLQQCKPCDAGTEYIIDPDQDVCERCPLGESIWVSLSCGVCDSAGALSISWPVFVNRTRSSPDRVVFVMQD